MLGTVISLAEPAPVGDQAHPARGPGLGRQILHGLAIEKDDAAARARADPAESRAAPISPSRWRPGSSGSPRTPRRSSPPRRRSLPDSRRSNRAPRGGPSRQRRATRRLPVRERPEKADPPTLEHEELARQLAGCRTMLDPDDRRTPAARPVRSSRKHASQPPGSARPGARRAAGQRGLEREHPSELQAFSLPHAQLASRAVLERRQFELLQETVHLVEGARALRRNGDVLTNRPLAQTAWESETSGPGRGGPALRRREEAERRQRGSFPRAAGILPAIASRSEVLPAPLGREP